VTAATTVVLAIFVRGLLAGYGGGWFFPVLATEAGRAALPFVVIAIVEWRWGGSTAATGTDAGPVARTILLVVECALLFALFGGDWIAPHTSIAEPLGNGLRLQSALIGVGAVIGAALARLSRRFPRLADPCVATIAAWLILGPSLYARFDTLEAGRRALAALTISGAFAVLALALVALELAGERVPRLAGLAGIVGVAATSLALRGPHPHAPRDSIVLVVVDTLRADMVDETLPGGAPLMPHLQAIARHGVRFTTAVAPSPWTLPSTASILSGMNPFRHQIGRMAGQVPLPGDPAASYLGTTLRGAGYQVAGFVNNPYLRPYYGFGRGFLRFQRYHGNARDGAARARAWIGSHSARPFLLLLHLMDPHWPYEAPPGFGEARQPCAECDNLGTLQYQLTSPAVRAEVRRRYEAEVAFTDAAIGELYDALQAFGALEPTWFIVVADHGEELWDHRQFLHGHTLYDELLRVPLVIVPPDARADAERGRVVDAQVRLEDVAPTLLDIAGLAPTTASAAASPVEDSAHIPTLDGVTLLPLLGGGESAASPRPAIAGFLQIADESYAVRTHHYKLIYWPGVRWPILFDLTTDPRETMNVVLQQSAVVSNLIAIPPLLGLVPPGATNAHPPTPPHVGADIERELRSLGYVQ